MNVDCLQNHSRRSLAAPYSLRAADYPVVSTPVRWGELEAAGNGPLVFTPADVLARVEAFGDLFKPLAGSAS